LLGIEPRTASHKSNHYITEPHIDEVEFIIMRGSSKNVGLGMGGVYPLQPTKGLGVVLISPIGSGWSPGRKHNLAYFEGHRTLLFAPIC